MRDRKQKKEKTVTTLARAFGTVLRTTRLEKGISQAKLAEITDMDRTYPSLLERGLRSPGLEMLFRISTALEEPPAFIVERTALELRRSEAGGAS
jgi:transcriptional regulator with XRE-family HTH domain